MPSLNTTEALYSNFFNSSIDGFAIYELMYNDQGELTDYIYIDLNDSYCQISSIQKTLAIGQRYTVVHSKDRAAYLEIYHKVNINQTNFSFETSVDKHIDLKISVFFIRKNIIGVIISDISQRKRLENDIIGQRIEFQSIYENIMDGLIVSETVTNKIIRCNSCICKMLGCLESDILSQDLFDIFPDSVEDLLNELTSLHSLIKKNKISLKTKNNSEIQVELSITQLEYNNDICYLIIVKDITKEIKTQELRDSFISNLSHDLKVPLLAHKNALNFLLKGYYGQLEENVITVISNILASNNDLLDLVYTLLDFYRKDTKNIDLKKTEANIVVLAEESIQNLRPLIENTNKKLLIETNNDPPSIQLDTIQIKRVFANILSNAIKHTDNNGVIKIIIVHDENNIKVCVSDNGYGISSKDLIKIFDPYYMGTQRLKKVSTGLGLYSAKQIIEAHNGTIVVDSKQEKGATFTFSLPYSLCS